MSKMTQQMAWEAPRLASLDVEETLNSSIPGCFETLDTSSGTLVIIGASGNTTGCPTS